MFGGRKYNSFVSRITEHMNSAIEGSNSPAPCATEIRFPLEEFFQKVLKNRVFWKGTTTCWHIEEISIVAKHLAQNTRNYEPLDSREIVAFKKILDELTDLMKQATEIQTQDLRSTDFGNKISCIDEIVYRNIAEMHDTRENHENCRDGMLFQDFENLYKVIHRVNTEWDELCSRGFTSIVFTDYWESFKYSRNIMHFEKSESEKFNDFMSLLDGKMKFVPVYENRPVCFHLVDNDFSGEIVHTVENRYSSSYHLLKAGEKFYSSNPC